jgi:diguanylate cyclase (GGDEF)-like protein
LGLAFPLVAILAGIFALAKGYRPAIFYLAAWSLLLGAGVLWAARGAGLLGQTGFVTYVFPLATALESVLLSFALTNRIRAMRLKMEKMQTEERRLLELSVTDGLTGLFNKRYMQSKLDSEVEHARRLGLPLSLLFFDVDNFKRFNDTYGHQAGDRVLETLATILRSNSRPSDSCCRYGGEEFVAILPGADPKAALAAAERIRQAFAGVKFHPQNGRPVSTGVSVGLALLEPGETAESLFRRADEALYQAKGSGKNRTVVAQVREPDVPGFPVRRTSPD